jgi:hypothetical protein
MGSNQRVLVTATSGAIFAVEFSAGRWQSGCCYCRYSLSYTAVLVIFFPCASVAVAVTVRLLPSADRTIRPLMVPLTKNSQPHLYSSAGRSPLSCSQLSAKPEHPSLRKIAELFTANCRAINLIGFLALNTD